MTLDYYFTFYGLIAENITDYWRSILSTLRNNGYSIDWDIIIRWTSEKDSYIYNDQHNECCLYKWLIEYSQSSTFDICIKNLNTEDPLNRMILQISPKGQGCPICPIASSFITFTLLRPFPGIPTEVTQKNYKLRYFNSILLFIKKIADVMHPYYGHLYSYEMDEPYIREFIIKQQTRYAFDLTFYSYDHKVRFSPNIIRKLQETGFRVDTEKEGYFIYFPVEYWNTKIHYAAKSIAQRILKISKMEASLNY
jgi:hypothetical protein